MMFKAGVFHLLFVTLGIDSYCHFLTKIRTPANFLYLIKYIFLRIFKLAFALPLWTYRFKIRCFSTGSMTKDGICVLPRSRLLY